MAVNTKILAFGIVVGATILSILYYLTIPSPVLHPISSFPVPSPPQVQNRSVEQTSPQSYSSSILQLLHLTTGGYLFQLFPPKFTCPYKKERLGGPKRGKWACGIRELYGLNKSDVHQSPPNKSCVMYSFGVGPEVAFDEAVLKITNCKVFAYDHTVNGIPSRTNESRDPNRMVYHKIGVKEYKNQSTTYLKSIKELMKINGHDWIDILKVDVEGAEYGSLNMLMDDYKDSGILPFDQLLVEVHAYWTYSVRDKVILWFNRLEAMGLRAVHAEKNPVCVGYEYNFVNVRGKVFRNSTYNFFQNGWTDMSQFYEVKRRSVYDFRWFG